MPDITNQDVINAIRGMYQGPNRVSDVDLQQKVDRLLMTLGAQADAAQTNPNAAASALALLKGLLKQLQGTGTGATPVSLTGSIPRKVTIETLANAQSVAASGNLDMPYTTQGESEVWVLVNIDKQPWTLRTRLPWASTYSKQNVYPQRDAFATAYPTVSAPAGSLLLVAGAAGGVTAPTSLAEAILIAGAYDTVIRVENGSANVATATVKVMRIWR